jgi:uncharacterized membrane protein
VTTTVEAAGRHATAVQRRRFRLLGPTGRFWFAFLATIVLLIVTAATRERFAVNDHTWDTLSAYAAVNGGFLVYLLLTYVSFRIEPAERIRARATVRRGWFRSALRRVTSFIWILLGIFFAVSAIAVAAQDLPHAHNLTPAAIGPVKALEAGNVLLTWLILHSVYAEFYANRYYREGGGLEFAGTDAPDYRDFAYFAFSVGMTFGTTDVDVSSSSFRRVMLPHKLFSFGFNTAILALVFTVLFQ